MRFPKILLVVLCVLPCLVYAEDRLTIEADKVEIDNKNHVSRYSGNVHVVKKDIEIDADEIDATHSDTAVIRIVAKGAPVQFRRIHQQHELLVKSKKMIYEPEKGLVEFRDSVVASREGNLIKGEYVSYDIARDFMQLNGGADNANRVRIELESSPTKRP